MKKRKLSSMLILTISTLGIYAIVWLFQTADEMRRIGLEIPSSWLLLVPFANIYWLWKYAEGVENIIGNKLPVHILFVMEFLCSVAGNMYLQKEFNSLSGTSADIAPASSTDNNTSDEEPPLVSTEQFQ